MNSTLNELELTPFKVQAVPGMKVVNGKRKQCCSWKKLTMRCQRGWQQY